MLAPERKLTPPLVIWPVAPVVVVTPLMAVTVLVTWVVVTPSKLVTVLTTLTGLASHAWISTSVSGVKQSPLM